MAFSIILLENLTELKTRRGNASSTTIASILGLNYPTTEGFSFYKWDDTSTATGDDNEVVHPTIGGGLPGRWFKIDILITAQLVIAALGYSPYDANNPDGFISNYIETDPTVPPFAKTLVSFAIIKALTDPLYKSIGYSPTSSEIITALGFTPGDVTTSTLTSGLAGKENTITAGTSSQYWRGDKTWQTLDKTAVGLGNLDNTSDLNKPISTATQTALNAKQATLVSGTNIKTINGNSLLGSGDLSVGVYTAGTGINIASNVITNISPDQTVSLTGANNFSVAGAYPNFTLTQYIPSDNTVTRTINSSTYTISTTKKATVKYNIKIVCTATIGSASSGKVLFQYSIDGGTNWIDAGEVENSNTVTLAIALNSTTTQSGFIVWSVPANALCRLVPTSAGTTTITWIRGQETY